MAHKVAENVTLYEPDISGEVDFSFFEDDSVVDRTKGCGEMVSGPSVSLGSSSSPALPPASCLEDSRYRCVEVTSSSSGRRQGEGHKGEEVWRRDSEGEGVSLNPNTAGMVGGSASSFEAQQLEQQPAQACAVMEHVDRRNPYSSDEWEDSDLSDTDGDHSDSSDDDDPKSQVDRLIDQVTLVYLDGENSNLSSETESSDESDYDVSDSESDITDVSPLISASPSPLGLSPVLPRRVLGTSPLALHDNRGMGFDFSENGPGFPSVLPGHPTDHCNGLGHSDDSTDMSVLLKAVVELEKKKRRKQVSHRSRSENSHHYSHHHYSHNHPHDHHNGHLTTTTLSTDNSRLNGTTNHQHRSSPVSIHPIDASPHHRHLRRSTTQQHRRKNMSFTNEEVRRIDRENQLLLQKIVSAHSKSNNRQQHHHSSTNRPVHRPANATVSRRREDERIRRENMILLRKIQEAKPSRECVSFRSPRHRASPGLRPPSTLPSPTPGSCGALARSGHAATPTPRKETAL